MPPELTLEQRNALIETLEAPRGQSDERALRLTFRPDAHDGEHTSREIAVLVKERGWQRFVPPAPLPPIQPEDVQVVVWMAVDAEEYPASARISARTGPSAGVAEHINPTQTARVTGLWMTCRRSAGAQPRTGWRVSIRRDEADGTQDKGRLSSVRRRLSTARRSPHECLSGYSV